MCVLFAVTRAASALTCCLAQAMAGGWHPILVPLLIENFINHCRTDIYELQNSGVPPYRLRTPLPRPPGNGSGGYRSSHEDLSLQLTQGTKQRPTLSSSTCQPSACLFCRCRTVNLSSKRQSTPNIFTVTALLPRLVLSGDVFQFDAWIPASFARTTRCAATFANPSWSRFLTGTTSRSSLHRSLAIPCPSALSRCSCR